MATTGVRNDLKQLRARPAARTPWWGGADAEGFAKALATARARIDKYDGSGPVVVAQAAPAKYLAGVLAAVEKKLPVVLANPRWGAGERAQAAAQITPGLWLGERSARWPGVKLAEKFSASARVGAILIPTGGTGGRVRWAVHTWGTLAAAARAFTKFFDADGCIHVGTLTPWHIGGLMPAVRALDTNGTTILMTPRRTQSVQVSTFALDVGIPRAGGLVDVLPVAGPFFDGRNVLWDGQQYMGDWPSYPPSPSIGWTTSDCNVCSVDEEGLVTAKAPGTARLYGFSGPGILDVTAAVCVVTVTP